MQLVLKYEFGKDDRNIRISENFLPEDKTQVVLLHFMYMLHIYLECSQMKSRSLGTTGRVSMLETRDLKRV